jgi:hypothetical protein
MTKTMSIRMDRDNSEFLTKIVKEDRSDLTQAVRDLVTRGRVSLPRIVIRRRGFCRKLSGAGFFLSPRQDLRPQFF